MLTLGGDRDGWSSQVSVPKWETWIEFPASASVLISLGCSRYFRSEPTDGNSVPASLIKDRKQWAASPSRLSEQLLWNCEPPCKKSDHTQSATLARTQVPVKLRAKSPLWRYHTRGWPFCTSPTSSLMEIQVNTSRTSHAWTATSWNS